MTGATAPDGAARGGERGSLDALWRLGGTWGLPAALVVLAVTPLHLLEAGPVLCPVLALTGSECPGCGITRAVSSCLHGDVGHAMELNLGVVVVLPALLLLAGRQIVRTVREPR